MLTNIILRTKLQCIQGFKKERTKDYVRRPDISEFAGIPG
jgi:hypothetical protein